MRHLKMFMISLITFYALFLTVNAQADTHMAPPKPLENKVFDSMVGTWAGNSDMMGKKMHDELKIKWGINHQFLIMKLKAKTTGQPQMKYEGMGVFGVDNHGKLKTWWFDSWGADSMSVGSGSFSDNKLTLSDSNAKFSETRSFEIKGNEMVMNAKGKMLWQGKETPFDNTTVYKKEMK